MTQIFLIGSSGVYGVGGENGGWADMIKQAIHKKMYGSKSIGEKYEVYNFAKPGETIDFVKRTFPEQLKQYGRQGKIITIMSMGGNNAKAKDKPDNYVSTPEEYKLAMSEILDIIVKLSTHTIAVGGGFYDESKTSPKISPFDGSRSYFTNQRKQEFDDILKKLCADRGIIYVDNNINQSIWCQKYLFKDGLHANKKGHEFISKNVLKVLEKII